MPLHIVGTRTLPDHHILVQYSDGSGAIFEPEELEKLRPVPREVLASLPEELAVPIFTSLSFKRATSDRTLVLDEVLA